MNARQLAEMATELAEFYPTAELVKNEVGNLAVLQDEVYIGYLDLGMTPELVLF